MRARGRKGGKGREIVKAGRWERWGDGEVGKVGRWEGKKGGKGGEMGRQERQEGEKVRRQEGGKVRKAERWESQEQTKLDRCRKVSFGWHRVGKAGRECSEGGRNGGKTPNIKK